MIKDTEVTTNVFVYGSLKRGFGNHRVMEDAGGELVGEFVSTSAHFTMFSLGAYPGIQTSGMSKVMGEVYRVPWRGVYEELDVLEGNGHFYKRHVFRFRDVGSPCGRGPIVKAWMYVCMRVGLIQAMVRSRGYKVEETTDSYDGSSIHNWERTPFRCGTEHSLSLMLAEEDNSLVSWPMS